MKNFLKLIIFFPASALFYIYIVYEKLLLLFFKKYFVVRIREKIEKYFFDDKMQILHENIDNIKVPLTLYSPNWVAAYRVETFSTKEPDTLNWIDKFGGERTFFDIGANVGLYSIYYSKKHPGKVYSFEPSVFNLKLLSKNIFVNNVQDKIKIIPNPVSKNVEFSKFSYSNFDEGGALSAFGVNYGTDGELLNAKFNYSTLGFSLDYLIEKSIISDYPELLKIDVDGIEHLVIEGAKKTLKNKKCFSIMIEVNKKFSYQMDHIKKVLFSCGFNLENPEVSQNRTNTENIYNQVWIKK